MALIELDIPGISTAPKNPAANGITSVIGDDGSVYMGNVPSSGISARQWQQDHGGEVIGRETTAEQPGRYVDLFPVEQPEAASTAPPSQRITPNQNSGTAGDLLTSVKRGVEQIPGQLAGLADIPIALATGDRPITKAANYIADKTGFKPGQWAEDASSEYSQKYQQQQAVIDAAWKDPNATAADVAKAYASNPSYIANLVVNSLPAMAVGGMVGRALMIAGRVAPVALTAEEAASGVAARTVIPGYLERAMGEKWAASVAGGIGEGSQQAGQQMQQGENLPNQRNNAIAALGSGLIDAVISAGAGRVVQGLGLETAETLMAKGFNHEIQQNLTGLAKFGRAGRMLGGAMSEGLLQEFPQSAQEQIWQNWSEGKPIWEGVPRQAVEGALAGFIMGAGANIPGHAAIPAVDPNAGVLTRAAKIAAQQSITPIPPGTIAPSELLKLLGTPETTDVATPPNPASMNILDGAAGNIPLQNAQKTPEKVTANPVNTATSGFASEVVMPDNTALPAHWEVVDADQVAATLKEGKNQPRDRSRAAANIQVQGIANMPDYRRLADSPVMDVGAPTLSQDGAIVGGNGRFEGVSQAYDQGTAAEYRARLEADAANKGIDPSTFAGMKKPVLVRRITQPFDTRVLAVASNSGGSLQYSALEQAKIDGDRMSGLGDIEVNDTGDVVMSGDNMANVRRALTGYNAAEMGSMTDKDGLLSQEGIRRIKNALLYKAYGNSSVLSRLVESADNDLRAVSGALVKAAGTVASVRSDMTGGNKDATADIVKDLLSAVELLSKIKSGGTNVDQYLSQHALFGKEYTEEAVTILRFLSENIRSQKRMAEFIRSYYDGLANEDNLTGGMFADAKPITKQERINHAIAQQQATAEQRPTERGREAATPGVHAQDQHQPENAQRAAARGTGSQQDTGVAPQNDHQWWKSLTKAEREAAIAKAGLDIKPVASFNFISKPNRAAILAAREPLLTSYTNQEVINQEAAREAAGRAEEAEIRRNADRVAAEREAATVNRNVNTVASDNFQLGQSKDEVKRMAQSGVVDMFSQPKPAAESKQSAQAKKLEVLKAQAQGKISGDQGAALKELADAGEHAAVDEVLKPAQSEAKEPWQMTREMAVWGEYLPDGLSTDRALAARLARWVKIKREANNVKIDSVDRAIANEEARIERANAHRAAIVKAIAEGKPVPAEVLADYPDLKPSQPAKTEQPASTKSRIGVYPVSGLGDKALTAYLKSSNEADRVAAQAEIDRRAQAEQPTSGEGEKISDFGEKIEGAKKDLWQNYRKAMSDELPAEAKEITLSKHFPEPDYENLISNGTDISAIAAIKAIRDEIPAKPKIGYKLKRWGEQLKTLREFSNDILSGSITVDKVMSDIRKIHALQGIANRIELYSELGYPLLKSAKGYEISGGWTRPNNPGEQFGLKTPQHHLSFFDTRQEAIDALREILQKEPEGGERSTKLDIYRVTKSGDIVIGKKVASNKYIDLKTGFKSAREAREYLQANEKDLLELLDKKKEVSPERRSVNNPRIGEDYRQGEDVTPEKFASEFGWRGVQFGNYVEGSRRQRDLNNAYDALLDMSHTIGIPSRAVSLNGSLGLAFGARGIGGVRPASAHYESDKVVINITKTNGAGSIGHEWFHALDNYFSKIGGKDSKFITDNPRAYENGAIRPEVVKAFHDLMQGIHNSDFVKRSMQLDTRRSKDYWSTDLELAARAFETYLVGKAEARGESSDYLANIVSEEAHNILNEAGKEFFGAGEEPYPFPTKSEQKAINPLFDKLFSTLKTKETDKGTMLYSLSDDRLNNHDEQVRLLEDRLDTTRTDAEQRYQTGDRVDPETGDFYGGGGGMYSNRPSTTAGMSKERVQRATAKLRASWLGFRKINIVQSVKDLPAGLSNGLFSLGKPEELTVEVLKVGRKWIEGKDKKSGYTNKIEINSASKEWKVGETHTFVAKKNFESTGYGTTVTIHPVTDNPEGILKAAQRERTIAEIERWLGFVEEHAGQYVYQKGVDELHRLGIKNSPEHQARLDAAIKKTNDAIKKQTDDEAKAYADRKEKRESSDATYLHVPYENKDRAKKHGAKWNPERRQWYVLGSVPSELEEYVGVETNGELPKTVKALSEGHFYIGGGEGYGWEPMQEGQTLRNPNKKTSSDPDYVTVVSASKRYFKEDGMSFGVGDESGYVYSATVRPATPTESAPLLINDMVEKERKSAKLEISKIEEQIKKDGIRPGGSNVVDGEKLLDTQTIYGGGDWFVIQPDAIWYVQNNGADGDSWSANNVRTGGAGAIGWKIPFDQTIADDLRKNANIISNNDLILRSTINAKTEGIYDPRTNSVYLIADNIATPDRAIWVAAHEIVGHGGIRMLGKPVAEALDHAAKNGFVAKLAHAIAADRGETFNSRTHTDEAIAELAAATLTGKVDVILERYGVKVPVGMRSNLLGMIRRVVDAVRNFMAKMMGKPYTEVSDGDVLDMLRQMKDAVEGKATASQFEPAGAAMVSVSGYNVEQSLLDKLDAIHKNVDAFLSIKDDVITLIELQMPKAIRGEGLGSKFMDILTEYADAHGMKIVLTAAGDFGGSKSGQERFYKRFGFVANKGRNKDFRFRENMIRRPSELMASTSTKQTDTAAFKAWFGNSKVVDAEGNPLRVYHGTKADTDFESFKRRPGDIGIHFGDAGQANDRLSYTNKFGSDYTNPRLMPVYLAIKNPLRLPDVGSWNADTLKGTLLELFPNDADRIGPSWSKKGLSSTKDIREFIQSKGYDGVVYRNTGEVAGGEKYAQEQSRTSQAMIESQKRRGKPVNVYDQEDQKTPEHQAHKAAYEAYAKFREDNAQDSYIAFERTQIKSAIGNRGTFDQTNPNILFSTAPAQPSQEKLSMAKKASIPEETNWQASKRVIQDKMIRFAVIRDWLTEQGHSLTEAADVWMHEGNMHGKVAARLEDFREKTINPLVKRTQQAGFTMGQVAEYLEMQHIPEANARMREIHNDPDATANGVTDAEAKAVMAQYQAIPNFAELKAVADDWRAISDTTRQILLDAGIITPEMASAWQATYQNYVPLKGDETQTGTGKGLNVNGKIKRRLGHGDREEAVIQNLLRDHERAIMLAEKNQVGIALIHMAIEAQNDDLITVGKPVKRQVFKDKVVFAVAYQGNTVASFETMKEAQDFIRLDTVLSKRQSSNYGIARSSDPSVIYMASPMLADNEVNVYINGHTVRVQLNDELLARAYTNMGVEHVGMLLSAAREFNSWLSKAYTGYNLEFAPVNMFRDLFAGTINLTGDYGIGMTAKIYANYPKAFKELLKSFSDSAKSRIVSDYRKAGGNTGAAYLSDIERIGKDVMNSYNEYAGAMDTYSRVYQEALGSGHSNAYANLKAAGKAVSAKYKHIPLIGHFLSLMEHVNAVTENALRVATYMTLKEHGYSDAKSAQAAKMSTVNFNRKGEMTATAGALYLFFNPNIQGTERIISVLGSSAHKNQARALTGMMVLGAFALAEMMRGGDDEDKWKRIPGYIKDRNIVFMFGDTQFMLPMPYGYGLFHTLGNVMSDVVHGENGWKAGVRLADAIFGNFSPTGNPSPDGNFKPLQLLPTTIKMAIAPEANENNFGRPIQPIQYNDTKPDSANMYRTTKGTLYAATAEGMNALTGGNSYRKGAVDISPETIKFWVQSLTGGAGKFLFDTVDLASIGARGVEPDLRELPIVRKFVREPSISDTRSMYWDAVKDAKQAAAEFHAAIKARDTVGAKQLLEKNKPLIAMAKYAEHYEKAIKAKRDAIDAIRMNDKLSLSEQRQRMKVLELQEAAMYDKFLAAFEKKTKQ